jgi:hypothetical protein
MSRGQRVLHGIDRIVKQLIRWGCSTWLWIRLLRAAGIPVYLLRFPKFFHNYLRKSTIKQRFAVEPGLDHCAVPAKVIVQEFCCHTAAAVHDEVFQLLMVLVDAIKS